VEGVALVIFSRGQTKLARQIDPPPGTQNQNKKEKLFIYLALAKTALPGQFDLLVSSQSRANASKYFFCSDAQHEIKVIISEQHKNILLFVSSTNF
jgi:hypothetical protein